MYPARLHVCASYSFSHMCVLSHAFIYGRFRRVDGPDARRHDKIAPVPNDTAIATREDSIYIRNFCSLTANTRSHIYHTRSELSVSGEILRLLFAFVKVLPPACSPNCFNPALIALRILNFLQTRENRKIRRKTYTERL